MDATLRGQQGDHRGRQAPARLGQDRPDRRDRTTSDHQPAGFDGAEGLDDPPAGVETNLVDREHGVGPRGIGSPASTRAASPWSIS